MARNIERANSHSGDSTAIHYVVAWLVLLAFTGLTWVLAWADLGALSLPVALLIALLKTSLVLVVFMHFAHEHGMSRLSLALALILLAALALLAMADAATRFPLATVRERAVPTHPRPQFTPPDEVMTPY